MRSRRRGQQHLRQAAEAELHRRGYAGDGASRHDG
jgi:hypothetical protein